MTLADPALAAREELLANLIELVQALDRRLPALQSAAETRVVDDAAALKRQATRRIKELTAER